MSNALAEIENTLPGEVVFLARYDNLVLVRQNAIDEVLVGGARRIVNPGKRYRFEQGVLRAKVGRAVMVDHDGWLARGAEENIERDEVDALRSHRRFNKDFWEVGKEPGRLVPYEETVLESMSEAVAALDVEALEKLLVGERETHNRPLLTRALAKALETTQTTRVKLEADANDKAAAEAAKSAKAKPAEKAEGKLP